MLPRYNSQASCNHAGLNQTSLASVIVMFSLIPNGQSMWRTSLLSVSMNTISTNSALNIAK